MNKKYWLRFGSVLFIASLVLCMYAAFIINQSKMHIYSTGQEPSIDLIGLLNLIPGVNGLVFFAYSPIGIYGGAVVLSLLYGIVGMIIGGIYGKIKNRKAII